MSGKNIRRFDNRLGAPKVLRQGVGAAGWIALREIDNVADVRSSPCVDGLIVVANRKERSRALMKKSDQFLLTGIDVLIFVYHEVAQRSQGILNSR